jgi:hypothetical protein
MALVSDPATVAELNATVGPGISEAYLNGVTDGTTEQYPKLPGYDKLKVEDRQKGLQGLLGTFAALLKAFTGRSRTNATLLNSFTGGTGIQYFKTIDGYVQLEGYVIAPSSPNSKAILQLPVGYRPSTTRYFAVQGGSGYCAVAVQADGYVICQSATASVYLALDPVRFSIL